MSSGFQGIGRNATIVRARELRRALTLPEGMLWQALRKRPGGLKFRRQHPIGPYIADFYCPTAKLIVEIDGQSHAMGGRPEHDARRDEWMQDQDLQIMRISANNVMMDMEAVLTGIIAACRS